MASASATVEDAASTTVAIAVKWQGKQFTVSLPEVPFVFSFFALLPHFAFFVEVSPHLPFALLLLCRAESSLVFFHSQEADVACLKRFIEVRVERGNAYSYNTSIQRGGPRRCETLTTLTPDVFFFLLKFIPSEGNERPAQTPEAPQR